MRRCIKSFLSIPYKCINLVSFVQDLSLAIYYSGEQNFTTAFPKCMLLVRQKCSSRWVVVLEHTTNICCSKVHRSRRRVDNCMHELCQGDMYARNHSLGIWLHVSGFMEKMGKYRTWLSWSSCRTLGESSSGPIALKGVHVSLRSLVTPSA